MHTVTLNPSLQPHSLIRRFSQFYLFHNISIIRLTFSVQLRVRYNRAECNNYNLNNKCFISKVNVSVNVSSQQRDVIHLAELSGATGVHILSTGAGVKYKKMLTFNHEILLR